MKKENLSLMVKGIIVLFIIIRIFRNCSERDICDLEKIKLDSYWIIVKKIETDNNIRERIFTGKTLLNKDTTIHTTVFSSIDFKINDTIIKEKGELTYMIKSKKFIERRTYFLDNGECNRNIETIYR